MNWEVVFYTLPSGKQPVLGWLAGQTAAGQRFVMVHSFHKKTQQTPKQELEKALKRMNDFLASDTPTV